MSMDAQEAALGLLSMVMGNSGINGAGTSSSSSAVSVGLGGGGGGGQQQPGYQGQQQQQRIIHHHQHHHPSSSSITTTTAPTTGSPVPFNSNQHPQHYQHVVTHRQHSPPSSSSSPHPLSHQHQQQQQQHLLVQQQQQHLHPSHFPPPTSSATLNSILGPPSSSPLIPAKRKIVLLDEGYETGRAKRGVAEAGEMGGGRDGREVAMGMGMGREVQGFGVGYGRVSAQRDEGEMMRMGMGTPVGRAITTKSPVGTTTTGVMDGFHHRPSSRPTSSSSSVGGAFNPYPHLSTTGKGGMSSPSVFMRGSMLPPTPLSPPPPPSKPVMAVTTPPGRKSKPLPPPDPPPPPVETTMISSTTSSIPSTHPPPSNSEPTSTDGIDCICAINIDDGFSVACDECGRWCHMACFNFPPGQNAASDIEFRCWRCEPRSPGLGVRAREIMRGKVGARVSGGGAVGVASGSATAGGLGVDGGVDSVRRRSPAGSVEGGRKGRKTSTPLVGGGEVTGKRKRRNSVVNAAQNGVVGPLTSISSTTTTTTPTAVSGGGVAVGTVAVSGTVEEEHVDIDEPWNQAYVHIREDVVADDETRQKLRLHAKNWRGITALIDDPSSSSLQPSSAPPVLNPTTKLKPIPQNVISAQPLLSRSYTSTHPSILPPSYALHTTTPLPTNSLIIPLKSRISTSTSYLRDPLNSYAHLGMPRPFVHLLGPPLDLSLDGRCVGNEARWVRSGCVPNAVLRPVLCREGKARAKRRRARVDTVEDIDVDLEGGVVGKGKGKEKEKPREDDGKEGGGDDDTTLGFALFATRDLKANEEVVLGWEWDDGNVVHLLPALMNTPGMFSSATTTSSPLQITQLRNQMANILHALSSTFATCACGAGSRDCVLSRMQSFVQASSGLGGGGLDKGMWVEALGMALDGHGHRGVDLGPLVGTDKRRGFRARERVPGSGGLGGMEVVPPRVVKGDLVKDKAQAKAKERVVVDVGAVEEEANRTSYVGHLDPQRQQHDLRPFDPGTQEERIHPRMRKKWMKGVVEKRREEEGVRENKGLTEDELAMLAMPPPPMPAALDPTTVSSTEEVRKVVVGESSRREVDVEDKMVVDTGHCDAGGDVVMDDVDTTTPAVDHQSPIPEVSDTVISSSPSASLPASSSTTTITVQPSQWSSPRSRVDSPQSSPEADPSSLPPPSPSIGEFGPPSASADSVGPPPSTAESVGPPPSSANSVGPPPSSATSIFSDVSAAESVKSSDTSSTVRVGDLPELAPPPPASASTVEGGDGDGDETEDEMPLEKEEHESTMDKEEGVYELRNEKELVESSGENEKERREEEAVRVLVGGPQDGGDDSRLHFESPPLSSPSTRTASPEPSPIPIVSVLPPDVEDSGSPAPSKLSVNGHAPRSPSPHVQPTPPLPKSTPLATSPLSNHASLATSPLRNTVSLATSPLQKPISLAPSPQQPVSVVVSPRPKPMRIDTDLSRRPTQEDESTPLSPTWSPDLGEGNGMEGIVEGIVDGRSDNDGEETEENIQQQGRSGVQPQSESGSQAQPHTEEHPTNNISTTSPEAEAEPEPTPAQPTKKKLSLAEFIARKKKMREGGQGAITPTAGGMTPTAGPGATLTPIAGPSAVLAPSGPGTMLGSGMGSGGGRSAGTLTPTPGQVASLTPTPVLEASLTPSTASPPPLPPTGISGASGMSVVGGSGGGGLGLGLRGAGSGTASAAGSPMGMMNVVVETEEKDGMEVDGEKHGEDEKDDAMKVDEEKTVNGRSKETLSPLLTMREIKDVPNAPSAMSKDVKKLLDSPAHHTLSPLIGVGSLNMPLTNGHSSTPLHSLSPVPPSTLGLGLGLGIPSSLSLAPSPLSRSPEIITTKEAKKEIMDVSLSVMNPGNRKATASPAILSDEHRFSRKPPIPSDTMISTPVPSSSSATSSTLPSTSTAPPQKMSTPPPPPSLSHSLARPIVHAPAPSAPSPLGLAPASPIHPDARNWQASPPQPSLSLSSPTMTRSPINGSRAGYRYPPSLSTQTSGMDRTPSAHARRQSQEDGEIGEHENEVDNRRHSGPLAASHPSTSHIPHSSFNTPPTTTANPLGPKRGPVPFPFRHNYSYTLNFPNHGPNTPSHSPPTHPRSFGAPKPTLPSRPGPMGTRSNGLSSDADSTSTPTSTSATTPTPIKAPTIPTQPSKSITPATSTPMSSMASNYGHNPPTAPRALRQSINNNMGKALGRPPLGHPYQHPYHPYSGFNASPNVPASDTSTAGVNGSNGTGGANSAVNGTSGPSTVNEHFIPRGPASQMRERHNKDDVDRDRDLNANANRDRDRCLPGSRWDSASGRDGVGERERDVRDTRDGGHYSGSGPGLGRYRGGMPSRGRYGGGWGEGSHWRK